MVCSLIDAAWPRNVMTRETRHLLTRILEPYDFAAVKSGLINLVKTHKWPPSIAELLGAVEGPEKDGLAAWGEVGLEVRRVGRGGTPSFSDPVLSRAVELFGWLAICDSRNEEADRVHFARLYDALRQGKGPEVTPTSHQVTGRDALRLAEGIGTGGRPDGSP